jgi:DNA-binding protein YbaB
MLQGLQKLGQSAGNLGKLKQQQDRLEKILKEIIVEGWSKNKKVKVTLNGKQEVLEVWTSPDFFKFTFENFFQVSETLDEELKEKQYGKGQKFFSTSVIEAFKDAMEKIQPQIVKKMQESGGIQDLMSMLQSAG